MLVVPPGSRCGLYLLTRSAYACTAATHRCVTVRSAFRRFGLSKVTVRTSASASLVLSSSSTMARHSAREPRQSRSAVDTSLRTVTIWRISPTERAAMASKLRCASRLPGKLEEVGEVWTRRRGEGKRNRTGRLAHAAGELLSPASKPSCKLAGKRHIVVR